MPVIFELTPTNCPLDCPSLNYPLNPCELEPVLPSAGNQQPLPELSVAEYQDFIDYLRKQGFRIPKSISPSTISQQEEESGSTQTSVILTCPKPPEHKGKVKACVLVYSRPA